MSETSSTISAEEAGSHFEELLERVENGETISIVRNGTAVASIAPSEDRRRRAAEAVKRIMARREKVLKAGKGLSVEDILQYRDEGRR